MSRLFKPFRRIPTLFRMFDVLACTRGGSCLFSLSSGRVQLGIPTFQISRRFAAATATSQSERWLEFDRQRSLFPDAQINAGGPINIYTPVASNLEPPASGPHGSQESV